MAEMYLQLFRQLKPNTQLQRSLRSFKLESNKVESGSKPTEWIAEWHDYYHHLTAIGYYQGIGCNQAFMEAGHLIFTAEMIEMNYYKPSVTAAFIEAWCGYIAEHEPKLLGRTGGFRTSSDSTGRLRFATCGAQKKQHAKVERQPHPVQKRRNTE